MKHPFIILGSAGGVLLLGGIAWAYFFLFYQPTPENARVAENPFVEVDAGAFTEASDAAGSDAQSDAAAPSSMSAVTTRRVAGAVGLGGGIYRFVEAGTGHAYETVTGGTETKISNTTFPQAHMATWSSDGSVVAISYGIGEDARTAIIDLDAPSTDAAGTSTHALSGEIHDLSWGPEGKTLRFVRDSDKGSVGIAYDIEKKTEKTVFQVPLREIHVMWDPEPIIVTKAARSLAGFAYTASLSKITEGMQALTAIAHDDRILFGGISTNGLTSWLVENGIVTTLNEPVIPEKCALVSNGVVCAVPKRFDPTRYPDEWYRGEETYDDTLRYIEAETGVARDVGDLSAPFRSPVDIVRAEPTRDGALMLSRDGHLIAVAIE